MSLSLDTDRLLGRSGLRVSPLALGAMTFGTEWGWDTVRAMLDVYLDLAALDKATAVELGFPHDILAQPRIRATISGGTTIRPR